MGNDGRMFAMVEVLADLLGRVNVVIEVRDERCDGSLEVDIVLPKRVISIDEQGLVGWAAVGRLEVAHMSIIGGRKDGVDFLGSKDCVPRWWYRRSNSWDIPYGEINDPMGYRIRNTFEGDAAVC